ncbi:esterase/lipase family protein [Aquabacterium sp.]|uniref:esterase/lipase family protein n=1 Tax=Aquabacterium sp. TaxID=1872578 RepID=UPI0040380520
MNVFSRKTSWLIAAFALTAGVAGSAHAAAGYAATKYPFVLAHGTTGFDHIGPVDYFYGITKDLQANGATVYTTQVSAWNSTDVRGEQFLVQFKKILAVSGVAKVNLLGHSQGAQTVRYAAGIMPDRVASVTTVNGVNFGSPVGDLAASASKAAGPVGTAMVTSLVNALGKLIDTMAGDPTLPQDTQAWIGSVSNAGADAFNARFPAGLPATRCAQGPATVNGIRFYSWGSNKVSTNLLDPLDLLTGLTSLAFLGKPNDGLVGQCDSHLGTVIRDDYPMNHFDAVNQAIGLRGLFDPVPLYRQHANRLKLQGL